MLAGALPAAADTCGDCHRESEVAEGRRSVHSPFETKDCGACHLDHGDEERLVLAGSGNALCERCHDLSGPGLLAAHRGISGPRASCLACHDPHSSRLTALLRPGRHRPLAFGKCNSCHRFDGRLHGATVRDLCLSCHDREEYSRPFVHSPVEEGECLACHDPHGSPFRALLLAGYSARRWVTEGEKDYGLCLDCHEGETFSEPVGEATEFRNGRRNMHRLHVEGEEGGGKVAPDRGLACRNCHEVHSSTWPRLIRRELDCGGVPCLMLEFRSLPQGGECAVSCHGTKAYSRYGAEGPSPALPAASAPPEPQKAAGPPSGPTPLEKSINRRCRSCHEKEVKDFSRIHVHLPVRQGNCSACHLDHGPDNTLVLHGRQDRLCARCHALNDMQVRAAHGNYPLERSRCSECHDPHAAGNPSLLHSFEHEPFAERECGVCHGYPGEGWEIGRGVNDLCAECHDDILDHSFLHSALPRKGCTGCHFPHASPGEKLLRAEAPGLCFRCHDEGAFTLETVHPPVEAGACSGCHPPHGSEDEGLLAGPYPLQQYTFFQEGIYGLCWKCHEEAELTNPLEVGSTAFRKGEVNLHALHLQNRHIVTELGERSAAGVACHSCHDPHSTAGPLLVRRELDCGGVPCLQMDYRKVGEGGSCLGGCHTRKSYHP